MPSPKQGYARRIGLRWGLSLGLILAVFFGFTAQAAAFDADDILSLLERGIKSKVLVTVIEDSTDLVFTAKGSEKLKRFKAPKAVIAAYEAKGAALKAQAEALNAISKAPKPDAVSDDGLVQETPQINNAIADVPNLPLTDLGLTGILTPIESSNLPLVAEKFFEDAYSAYLMHAEIAKRYAELQTATADARASEAELPRVAQYRALIATDPASALTSCLALEQSLTPHPDTPLAANLKRCIGEALAKLEAPAMAALFLDQALQASPPIADFSKSFEIFLNSARKSNYVSSSPIIIKENAPEIAKDLRRDFLYFMAYSLSTGSQDQIEEARLILKNIVAQEDIVYPKSLILRAALEVKAPYYRFKTAAEILEKAIQILRPLKTDEAFQLRNTAHLALARIAFENNAYDMAESFYRRVDPKSHHFAQALLESAWNQVFAKNPKRALALSHVLQAPSFKHAWLPDLYLIEAAAYHALCRYDQAEAALSRLQSLSLNEAAALRKFISTVPTNDYYTQVIAFAKNSSNALLPPSVFQSVLADHQFYALHKSLSQLLSERQSLAPQLRTYLTTLYDQAVSEHQKQIASRLAHVFENNFAKLNSNDISASQVAIEIQLAKRQRDAQCLKLTAAGAQCQKEEINDAKPHYDIGHRQSYWKYDGEFWGDEWLSLQSGLNSLCPSEQTQN